LREESTSGLATRILGPLLAVGLTLAVLASCAGGGSDADRPPRHVVLISLDTTRADQLGLYGNPTVKTPHLDRLAAESVVLDDFMTVVPTTLPSHVSLFTGKYPHNHGTPRNGFLVSPAPSRSRAGSISRRGSITTTRRSSGTPDRAAGCRTSVRPSR
jgi:hypothetical protein